VSGSGIAVSMRLYNPLIVVTGLLTVGVMFGLASKEKERSRKRVLFNL
jgi:hypothetical protein